MGKTAIITGAASGFGSEFSKFLARDEFDLVLLDKNGPGLQNVKRILEETYPVKVDIVVCDLSKQGCVNDLSELIKDLEVDVLINNAGYGIYGYFTNTNWQSEEEMICLQILNLTYLTKICLQKMTARGSGRVMNVSSVAAFQPGPLMAVYYATKAYILSFTQALSNEVRGTGVTVTAFCPGQTRTNFQQTVAHLSGSPLSSTGWFIAELHKTAQYGYDAMMAGKPVAIPGILNKSIVHLNRVVPRKLAMVFLRRMQVWVRK